MDINRYILNWLISFISNRKQRVVVDNIITEYIDITREVPQGTVLGPTLFSLMINDIKPVSPSSLLVKGAMSPHTHARANGNKLEKVGQSFSSSVGDFGRLFLSV